MTVKRYQPTSPGRRQKTLDDRKDLHRGGPEKSLITDRKGSVGRAHGRVTVRHRSRGAKKRYRRIDFKRDKKSVPAQVERLEYDPNRGAHLALLVYKDGEKRYILAPEGLSPGDTVVSGENVEMAVGNALPLRKIPVGIPIHNIELHAGRGGQLVRGAGTAAKITAKEGDWAQLKMPSGEIRKVRLDCYATVGQVSNPEHKTLKRGKAGVMRHKGVRPTVRGVAQHPGSHPHGGGEGRSGIGMKSPKSPWGKRTLGKKTRRRKHTDKYIVKDRRKGKRS
jgi:large subunit ribosomal protein L2